MRVAKKTSREELIKEIAHLVVESGITKGELQALLLMTEHKRHFKNNSVQPTA